MTDMLPTVDITPDPEPAAESRTWPWKATLGTAAAILAIAGAGVALSHHTTPGTSTATPGICGEDWVEVRSTTFNGISLNINRPGPDTITVDLWGSFDEHRRLVQQVPKKSGGANFMAWDFGYKIEAVEVSLKDGSYCFVSDDILEQLNTANGHPR